MKAVIAFTAAIYFLIALQDSHAAEMDIQLIDINGTHVENYGCEWNFMDEQGHAHPQNPFFGSRFTRGLPNGVWRVIVSCGALGSGNDRIISTKEKQRHIIRVGN